MTSSLAGTMASSTSPFPPGEEGGASPLPSPPPTADDLGGASMPEASSSARASVQHPHHEATSNPEASTRAPRRYLDPELAEAIKEAKLKTGASWRRVAKFTGLSHSYLVQLSNGQRVPSVRTVELLAEVLPFEEASLEHLRFAADSGPDD